MRDTTALPGRIARPDAALLRAALAAPEAADTPHATAIPAAPGSQGARRGVG
ncbi:MAG TPA: hypothetical protein VIZ17_03640 [Acetobacteraceae bacterium]